MRILNFTQMRKVEERAFKSGISYYQMIKEAGEKCTEAIVGIIEPGKVEDESFLILCGNGNNAGDGFVIAQKLRYLGADVKVLLLKGQPKSKDAMRHFENMQMSKTPVIELNKDPKAINPLFESSTVIVDCIFGIGFNPKLKISAEIANIFKAVNKYVGTVFSVDLPSGLASDEGSTERLAIKADYTFALSNYKPAHILKPAALFCGQVIKLDLGFSPFISKDGQEIFALNEDYIKSLFKPISPMAHKGDFGRLYSVCGSYKMPGAAVFAAKAAVLSGTGLVTAVFPKTAYSAIASGLDEPTFLPLEASADGTFNSEGFPKLLDAASNANALLVGCGIGNNSETSAFVEQCLQKIKCPMVIDADALNCLASKISLLRGSKAVITPHLGEMSKLCAMTVEEIKKNKIQIARDFAKEYGLTLVLKGANTLVAHSDGRVAINTTGNPGLATGGSGDVLAGLIASFLAQGMKTEEAAQAGVFIHGLAADKAVENYSMRGLTPSRLLEFIPKTLSTFESLELFQV